MGATFRLQPTARIGAWIALVGAVYIPISAQADLPTLGVGVSKLTYRESSLGVTRDAWLPTMQSKWTPDALQGNLPIIFSGQVAKGHADYVGTGSMNHQPMSLFQWQVQSPHAQWANGYQISPGLGYRQLYTDARGFTSTGAEGYRRTSEYWYASLAAEQTITNGWRSMGQFYYLLSGKQTTHLGDVSGDVGKLGTVKNTQHRGYGLNFGVCKAVEGFDVCPSFEYWRISESDTLSRQVNGQNYLLTEPANTTKTFQLLVHYKFKD